MWLARHRGGVGSERPARSGRGGRRCAAERKGAVMNVEDPWVLGIDFGTSFTVAAARGRRGPEVIEVGGERRVPSVVLADDDGSLVVGRAGGEPGHIPSRSHHPCAQEPLGGTGTCGAGRPVAPGDGPHRLLAVLRVPRGGSPTGLPAGRGATDPSGGLEPTPSRSSPHRSGQGAAAQHRARTGTGGRRHLLRG